MNSPSGSITKDEGMKSIRDALLIAASTLLPQVLDIIGAIDFGNHTALVSLAVAMITPAINRILRSK